jgi:hypothetical protein
VRTLALLLLLANLLFLAWGRWVAPREGAAISQPPDAAVAALHPIRLRGEPGPAPDSPAGPAASLLAATCVSVGPYAEPAQAAVAAAELTRLGFSARQRSGTDDVRVGTWVHVADLATPVDARNALAALRAAGLDEASLVTDPAAGEAEIVSVGVYADPGRATEAADRVRQAGFAVATSERRRMQDVIWLDVDREANGSLPALEALPAPPAGALPLELRACPDVTDSTVGAGSPGDAAATNATGPAPPGA